MLVVASERSLPLLDAALPGVYVCVERTVGVVVGVDE